MAKENGLGATLSIDDSSGTARAVTNDVRDVSISTPKAHQDVTGLDKSAIERIQLLTDATIDVNGIFNDAATTGLFTVLKTIPSTSVQRTASFAVSGNTLSIECMFNDMKLSRQAGGELLISTRGELADGSLPAWS